MTCPTCNQPLPRPPCECGHTEASHALGADQSKVDGATVVYTVKRGSCSVRSGSQAVPCGCKAWRPIQRSAS
jgi:hypothetical protein